jgi:hypothetical protein
MDGARDHFLANSTLSADQDCDVARRHLLDERAKLYDHGMLADQGPLDDVDSSLEVDPFYLRPRFSGKTHTPTSETWTAMNGILSLGNR